MEQQYIIGVDIGTSGCKSLLIDDVGKVVARAQEEYSLSIPKAGWSEQDPKDWWKAVKNSIKRLLKGFYSINNIRVIGLSGQMHGLVALDKDSQLVRPCILWNDQRTEKQCQEIHDRVGGTDEVLKLTCNRMLPGYTGGKILWVRENEPKLYEKIKIILNPKDYIRFCLTGEYATEVSDASGTGLFNVWLRDWSYQILEVLDIPKEWLPNCYESPEVSGKVMSSIAEELGLPAGLPVVGGGGDAVAQSTGMGIVEPGILGTTIGTAGNVAMALDKCYKNPEGKLQVFCSNMPNKWHVLGVTLAAGGCLQWFKNALGDFEMEISKRTGENVYDIISKEALKAKPGAEGLLFLPYLMGERCPHIAPNMRGAFLGLTLRHFKSHMIRSILEGVIFSLKDVTELFKEMGVCLTEIRTSGGGSVSRLWRQIHADIFNSKVITMSNSAEGAAYGAALIAGGGVGIWPSVEEAVKVLFVETEDYPIHNNFIIYNKLFPIYRNLYETLTNSFNRISEIYTLR